jgi:hypothetical protein
MSKMDDYRRKLKNLENWKPFLLKESGLPGPRGNIELAQAVSEEGSAELFEEYRSNDASIAPVNSQLEFLVFCGVLGLGRLISEGRTELMQTLRVSASDSRWRTREAVAMALQKVGQVNMPLLMVEMKNWVKGNSFEQRAVAAALCEPKLLVDPNHIKEVIKLLDTITASVEHSDDRKTEGFIALRKGLAYCWSVAASALPELGQPVMEKWFAATDKDLRWIMRENLKKKRLEISDPEWVRKWKSRLNTGQESAS